MRRQRWLGFAVLMSLSGVCWAQKPPAVDDARIDQLLRQMTLEEKLLQLLSYVPNGVPRLGIPDLKAGEVLHGVVSSGATSFPQSIALGATWDPALMEQIGTVVAQEARAVGIDQGFAPMLGLARDPRWGRVEESYGEDPYLVSRMGVGYILGLQGRGAERFGPGRIIATPKHFVADGEPFAGENGEDFETSERVLREVYLPPFEAAVKEAYAGSIMPAHHAINGVPAHANSWLLGDVLRREWGFDGFATSDMGDIPKLFGGHRYATSPEDAAVKSLEAGVDMELSGGPPQNHEYLKYLAGAVRSGKLAEAVVDVSARRVLRAKLELLGLAAPSNAKVPAAKPDAIAAYTGSDDIWAKLIEEGNFTTPAGDRRADAKQVLGDPSHAALALKAAQESIVLLKNEGGLLPLDRHRNRTILVVGPLASIVNPGGYSGGPSQPAVTALDGVKHQAGSEVSVIYKRGCTLDGGAPQQLAEAVDAARSADVVIAVVGHTRAQAGENHDRDNLDLPGGQERMIEALAATGKPLIVVLNNGAPFATEWIHDHIPAVIESWYGGQAYGTALAQILFGEVNPSAKLNVSIPRNLGQIPAYYNHPLITGPINFKPDQSGNLWAFGHGLSYTTFAYSDIAVSQPAIGLHGHTELTVKVTNTGKMTGVEVVQFYLHQEYTSLKRPVLELKGFERVSLKPGESRVVGFPVGFEQVKFWKNSGWAAEPGDVTLYAGSASDHLDQKTTLHLTANP